jgi:hypothetical protein
MAARGACSRTKLVGSDGLERQEMNAIDQHIERAYPDLRERDHSQRAEVDLTGFSNEELLAGILGQRVH